MTDVVDSNAKTLVVDSGKAGAVDNGLVGMAGIWPLMSMGMMGNQHNNLADLVTGLHNAEGHREIVGALRDEGRHLNDTIHDTSHNIEMTTQRTADANLLAIQGAELRTAKEICEVKELIRQTGCEIKADIAAHEAQRTRDELAQTRAELLALKSACCNPCNTAVK